MLKTRVEVELKSRELREVTELGLLDTRYGVFGELVFDEEMSVLFDSISVHSKNNDIAPRC